MPKSSSQKIVTKSIITVLIVGLITALGVAAYLNRQKLADFISANTYTHPAEITALEKNLALTDNASIIYYATRPSLDARDVFNEVCDSHEEQISILGCYTGGKIHLYDINSAELVGVKESTAAHELLHAVWERMSPADKSNIGTLITAVYNDEKYHALLAEDLSNYAEQDRLDELHSRIGTEIAELPAELENHYARYFKNQDLVVDFYDSYITPFKELSEEIDTLAERLSKLDADINQKTQEYYKSAEALSAKINEFNNCADTTGCFATDFAFYARRNQLLAEQTSLEDAHASLNRLIEEYNALVEEYNDNILRSNNLERIINSNSADVEEIDN